MPTFASKCLPLELLYEIVPFIPAENATPNALSSCWLLHKLLLPRVVKWKERMSEYLRFHQQILVMVKGIQDNVAELTSRVSDLTSRVSVIEKKIGIKGETTAGETANPPTDSTSHEAAANLDSDMPKATDGKTASTQTDPTSHEAAANLVPKATDGETAKTQTDSTTNEAEANLAPQDSDMPKATDGKTANTQTDPTSHEAAANLVPKATDFKTASTQTDPTTNEAEANLDEIPPSMPRHLSPFDRVLFHRPADSLFQLGSSQAQSVMAPNFSASYDVKFQRVPAPRTWLGRSLGQRQPSADISRLAITTQGSLPGTSNQQEPPHFVSEIGILPLTPHSRMLYWNRQNHSAVSYYLLECKVSLNSTWVILEHKWVQTPEQQMFFAEVSRLMPNQTYVFRVKVYDKYGREMRVLGGPDGLTVHMPALLLRL